MCRKLIYLISFVLVLGLISDASAGLVAHWKLDEDSGTTAVDATGNGHDGELIGNPEWVTGYFGGGLKFAGTPDKVDVPYSAELNPENEFTVSVWANLDPDGSGHRSPITSRDDYPQRGYIIYCTPENTWQFWTGTGSAWNSAGSPPVALGEWTHVAATYSNGEKKLYINGELAGESSATMPPNTAQVLRIGAGATEGNGNYFFVGTIDDVWFYDRTLSADQVQGLFNGIAPTFPKAEKPDPEDGAMLSEIWVNLGWSPGDSAVSHDVYLGDNFDDVNDGTADTFRGNQPLTSTTLIAGFFGFPYPDGLVPGTTYYWRIDEVNDADPNSPWKGNVWSFFIPPRTAYDPIPADGVKFAKPDVELSWTAGFNAKLHYVFFGDNFDDVNNAVVGLPQSETTYSPGTLELEKVYYWRVDEFDGAATHKGDVWSFRTLPDIAITDPNLVGWWMLDEGSGTTAVDWSGHDHHGTLINGPQWEAGYHGGLLDVSETEYAAALWFKTTNGNCGLMAVVDSDLGVGGHDRHIYLTGGNIKIRLWDTEEIETAGLNLANGLWHHVVYTYGATIDGQKVYVDGVLRASGTKNASDFD